MASGAMDKPLVDRTERSDLAREVERLRARLGEMQKERDRFRLLFETSGDAIILFDGECCFDCNDAAVKVFGYRSREEILGCHPAELSPPLQLDGRDSRVAAEAAIAEAFRTGHNKFEWLHRRASSEPFLTEVLLSALNLDGRPLLQATVRDISESRAAGLALAASERRFRELVDEAAVIILRWDTQGNITYFNRYAQAFFGYDEAEIIGRNVVGTIVPEEEFTGRDLAELMEAIQADPKRFEYNENENMKRNGERVWIAWKNWPAFDEEGRLVEVLSSGIDMTPRREIEEEVRIAHDMLEAHVAERTEELRRINENLRMEVEERQRAEKALAKLVREHEAITSAVPDLLFCLDTEGCLNWWNRCVEEVTGLTGEELMGSSISYHVIAEDLEAAFGAYRSAMDEGYGEVEARIRTVAGIRLYHFRGVALYDKSGKPTGTANVGRDITERKREAEAARRYEKERLAIFEHLTDIFYRSDREGRIIEATPSVFDLLQVTPAELIGNNIVDYCADPGDAARLVAALKAAGGNLKGYEMALRLRNGGTAWVLANVQFFHDEDGRTAGIEGIIQNITARKEAEEERLRLLEQLRQAQKMEALGTLVGGIAHDFNNVLGGMGINNFLLAGQVEGEQGKMILERNGQLIGYSKRIIRQLLAFSNRKSSDAEKFCLVRLMQESMDMARLSLTEEVHFAAQLPESELCMRGDPSQIQQILLNLVNNARDAVEGVESPEIGFELTRFRPTAAFRKRCPTHDGDSYALLRVRDNGCGISEENREHVFEPFFTTKEQGKGTGLGLSTVYGTVQAHDGIVEIDSMVGKGTVVSVYLPLTAETMADCEEAGEQPEALAGEGETVLLADDDEPLRRAGREALEELGYRVLEAANGAESVEMFRRYRDRVKLAIIDVVMPVMGGVEAAHRIREDAAELPIIFVTGYDLNETLGSETCPPGCLVRGKPFEIVQLSRDMRKLLAGKAGWGE